MAKPCNSPNKIQNAKTSVALMLVNGSFMRTFVFLEIFYECGSSSGGFVLPETKLSLQLKNKTSQPIFFSIFQLLNVKFFHQKC